MKSDSVLVTIAVVAVLASFAGLLMNYGTFSNFSNLFTGFATNETTGTVNVSIGTSALIEIVSANGVEDSTELDWGSGTVTDPSYALLVTNGTSTGGSWDPLTEGFIINNSGNVNVNLTVWAADDADSFIGGSGALFQYNLTNYIEDSCASGSHYFSTFVDFSTTETAACDNFTYGSANQLRMDLLLLIPINADPTQKSTTVTLGYEEA